MAGDLTAEAIRATLSTAYVGRRLVVVERTTSTMDLAAREAASGAPEGTVIVAEEQTAKDGAVSVGLGYRRRAPRSTCRYSFAPRLACCPASTWPPRSRRRRRRVMWAEVEAEVKWPNDVQVRGRKLAGVLVDAASGASGAGYAIVGVGLNVNLDVAAHPEIAETATSLRAEAGREISRLDVLVALLVALRGALRPAQGRRIIARRMAGEAQRHR